VTTPRQHPYLAPLNAGSHAGLQPAILVTNGFDPLRDVGHAYAQKLAAAGKDLTYVRNPDLTHGFPQFTRSSAACHQETLKLAHSDQRPRSVDAPLSRHVPASVTGVGRAGRCSCPAERPPLVAHVRRGPRGDGGAAGQGAGGRCSNRKYRNPECRHAAPGLLSVSPR
jgi:hypothetical protein